MLKQFDVLILGSGTAGQSLALRLADREQRVALITKRSLADSASAWAQGGIAAVLDSTDSIEAHIQDTFTAGAGLCDPVATRFVVEHGKAAIDWLIARGVPFTREDASSVGYHLTREGGHSHRRIIHAADATGAAVQATLTKQVLAHPYITVFEQHIAIDLVLGDKIGHPG
ncbi:MAG TPA: FAD-dependent oxidoreductase, partial [Pseudothauera hydrothermalis]|nr:FAD-dependent oxidoreductase [Pseudothauera hydrothermalis]